AAEARAQHDGRTAGDDRLDDPEHAGAGDVREVGREVGDLQRDALLREPRAEELRLRAAGAGGEAVEVGEDHGAPAHTPSIPYSSAALSWRIKSRSPSLRHAASRASSSFDHGHVESLCGTPFDQIRS